MINPQQIFPYAAMDDLQLRIDDIQLTMADGHRLKPKADPAVAIQPHSVDLSGAEKLRDWRVARIALRMVIPTESVRGVLPNGQGLGADCVPLVSVRCRPTRVRRRLRLTQSL